MLFPQFFGAKDRLEHLGHGNLRMAHQLGYGGQVTSVYDVLARKGMTEGVRVYPSLDTRSPLEPP